MVFELKDAFLFLLDIFKGKLPLQDLYLLVFILVVTTIAESIQERRKQSDRGNKNIWIYLKWIPLSFLACSIYLMSFYFIANIFTEFFFISEVFQQQQNTRSIAIMSLTMISIASLVIAIWSFKKTLLTVITTTLFIAIGMYIINVIWYKTIIVPLWCYGLIGVGNTILIQFLLLGTGESVQSNTPDHSPSRTSN